MAKEAQQKMKALVELMHNISCQNDKKKGLTFFYGPPYASNKTKRIIHCKGSEIWDSINESLVDQKGTF